MQLLLYFSHPLLLLIYFIVATFLLSWRTRTFAGLRRETERRRRRRISRGQCFNPNTCVAPIKEGGYQLWLYPPTHPIALAPFERHNLGMVDASNPSATSWCGSRLLAIAADVRTAVDVVRIRSGEYLPVLTAATNSSSYQIKMSMEEVTQQNVDVTQIHVHGTTKNVVHDAQKHRPLLLTQRTRGMNRQQYVSLHADPPPVYGCACAVLRAACVLTSASSCVVVLTCLQMHC